MKPLQKNRIRPCATVASLRLLFFLLGLSAATSSADPATFPISYSGRLTTSGGSPLNGPVDIQLRFFTSLAGVNQVGETFDFPSTELAQGVFQIRVLLDVTQLNKIFGDGTSTIYAEVAAGGKTYPRQEFTFVPLALKVPVDGSTIGYSDEGRLRVVIPPRTGSNLFLTTDAVGKLAWETPSIAKLQGQTVGSAAPSAGQVLTYNGSQWVPSTAVQAEISISAGQGLLGGTILNRGTISLATTSVTPGTYSRATVSVDEYGRITNAITGDSVSLSSDVSGSLSVANGGTGATSLVNNGLLVGAGNLPVSAVTGQPEQLLTVDQNGSPIFGTINLAATQALSGVLPLNRGGLGADLSSSGGAGQYLKKPTADGPVTVGSLSATDITNGLGYHPVSASGDTMSGSINMNGQSIEGLPLPINSGDAVPKSYVDAASTHTFTATQSSTSTAPEWSSTGNSHNLNLPMAAVNGVSAGLISNADYAEFSARLRSVTAGVGIDVSNDAGTATLSLLTFGTAGTYAKVITDNYGRVSGGTSLTESDVTSALGLTPVNKSGDTMSGSLSLGSNDLLNIGNLRMAESKTLALGTHASDPTGLGPDDEGATWYNSASNQIRFWDGAGVQTIGAVGGSLSSLNGQSGAIQTFGTPGFTGFAPEFSSAGNVHTLNIPMAAASGVTAGLISKSDYDSFVAKQSAGNYITSITGDVTSSGFSNGTVSSTLAGVAIPGTSTKVTYDAKGRVVLGMTLAASDIPPLNASAITSGTLPVSLGGTGSTSLAANSVLIGNGTSAVQSVAPGTSGNILTSNGTTWQSTAVPATTWATPGTIGSTTPNTGAFTSITTNAQVGYEAKPFGVTSGNTGEVRFDELSANGTNFVGFKAPDSLTANKVWVLPPADGTAGQVLKTDGVGNLSWVSAATGSVTNVTGTAPISVATGTSTPVISISQANTTTSGFLSSTDWTTFNAKQDAGNFITQLAGDATIAGFANGTGTISLASVAIAGTSTKVTYDVKGRVLSGTSLAAADIPALSAATITSGTLNVANGGTGATSLTLNNVILGNGTSPVQAVAPGTSGNVLTSNGTTWQSTALPATTWATPGTIGSTTPNTGAFTSITSNSQAGYEAKPFGVTAGNTGEVRFDELAANGTNYVGFKAPDSLVANKVWVLPPADGTAGQVLKTDGTGNLSWVTAATGSVTSVGITAPAAGITVAGGPITQSGSMTLALSNDLAAVEGLSTTGAVERTGADTWATYTLTAAGKALLDDADATTQRTTLGLGSLATASAVSGGVGGTITDGTIVNADIAAAAAIADSKLATITTAGKVSGTAITSGNITTSGAIASNAQGAFEAKPFGTAAGNTSEVRFDELAANGANFVGFKAPDSLAADKIWTLPGADGTAGQVLKTDGAGNLSWVSAATGSVTNVTGTAPISVATGTSTPVISISQANGATSGFLSSTDWTTFNAKQAAGNYITQLTGDITLSGFASGTATATLPSVAIAGTSTKVTYDVKGRVLSGTSLAATDIPALSAGIITSGTLNVANGGTGATSLTLNNVILGNGTSPVQAVAPGTSGNVLTSNGTTWQSTALPATTWATPGTIGSTTPNTGAFTSITTNAQAGYEARPFGVTAGNTGEVRFDELAANGTNYVGFKAPDLLVASKVWVLPAADGTAGQVLKTDGTGNLSWVTAATGSVTSVGITAPAAGITVAGGPITSSGSMTLALSNDLAAVEGLSTTGAVERTGADTWATYTLTAAGKALLDDADVTAQRTTLGLGSLATAAAVSGGVGGTITDGTITNDDISITAAIADSKLATISTAGKVSGTAVTSGNITTTGAIASSAQGAFEAKPFGIAAGNTSEVRFDELAANGTNYVGFKAPDLLAASKVWVLPPADGTAGQMLKTDGAGNLGWVTGALGSVTSVTATAPISVATGTTTPAISISQATATANGFLSSTDWSSFNGKQSAGSYLTTLTGDVTTSGFTSGSATATLATVATAGTSTKVTYDAKGRITSGTSLVANDIPPLSAGLITSGTLSVANGGTGAVSLTANNVLLGNGTSALQTVAPGISGNVLTSNGTTWASTALPATTWAAPGTIGSTTPNTGAFTTLTTSGNVGIGTTTTTEKLTVNGNIKAGSDWMMGSRMGAGFRIELKQVAFTCAASTWCIVSATWDRAFSATPYCFVSYHVTVTSGSIVYTAAASTGMGPTTTGCKQSFYADSNGWTGNVQFMGIGQ